MNRVKGTKDLVFDAVEETTNLVERMHVLAANKSFRPLTVVEPVSTVARTVKSAHDLTASGVYRTIRLINRGIGRLIDAGAGLVANKEGSVRRGNRVREATPLRSDARGSRSWWIDHAESALNALYGDYLGKKRNGLDLGMSFRQGGRVLPLEREAIKREIPDFTGKICIFVHGLGCTEWGWSFSAGRLHGDPSVNFGSMLKEDFGFTPLYIRYNTGRHVSENGRQLSTLLTQLMAAYPGNIEEIVIVGHSMGGLVARSAAFYGNSISERWIGRLRHIFCVGSPNLGAPLEKSVNILSNLFGFFNTVATQVHAELINSRSAGIKDLRFGYTVDEEWNGRKPDKLLANCRRNIPFVDGVGYYFMGATISKNPDHPVGVLFGDMLVRLPSAAGKALEPGRGIPFHAGNLFSGMNHFVLANHPEIYEAIRNYIQGEGRVDSVDSTT